MSRSSERWRRLALRALHHACALLVAVAPSVASPDSFAGDEIDRKRLPPELAALDDDELGRLARMSPLPPLAEDRSNRFAESADAAELGHLLFFETRISPKGVSCATCHQPERYFTDGKALAEGVGVARRNAPTVVDSARRRWIGWDGKFDSVWSQALAPIEHPDEMGSSRERLLRTVRDDAPLRSAFERAFGAFPAALAAATPDPLADRSASESDAPRQPVVDETTVLVLKALAAYQRKLASGLTPLDRFIAALKGGDGAVPEADGLGALSPAARRGLATFVGRGGCYQCHRGPSFTDEEFHALGLAGANGRVPDDPARLAALDFLQGNPMNSAGSFSDERDSPKAAMVRGLRRSGELFGQFRTPALRGVALTPPFMHDGRFASLDDVVRFYDTLEGASPVGHHGEMLLEPLGLGEEGRADLVAFLRALSPDLPDSGIWVNPSGTPMRTGQGGNER